MTNTIPLRIILEQPPAGVDFGLQKGSGSKYETIQTQRSGGEDLSFDFSVLIKNTPDGQYDFAGEYVQGNRGARFIYVDIGTYAGQFNSPWGRRLKIPLTGISTEMIQQCTADPSGIITCRVPGTGKDGGPNCATVKPFSGWYI
jgi:hypothetical protein